MYPLRLQALETMDRSQLQRGRAGTLQLVLLYNTVRSSNHETEIYQLTTVGTATTRKEQDLVPGSAARIKIETRLSLHVMCQNRFENRKGNHLQVY